MKGGIASYSHLSHSSLSLPVYLFVSVSVNPRPRPGRKPLVLDVAYLGRWLGSLGLLTVYFSRPLTFFKASLDRDVVWRMVHVLRHMALI